MRRRRRRGNGAAPAVSSGADETRLLNDESTKSGPALAEPPPAAAPEAREEHDDEELDEADRPQMLLDELERGESVEVVESGTESDEVVFDEEEPEEVEERDADVADEAEVEAAPTEPSRERDRDRGRRGRRGGRRGRDRRFDREQPSEILDGPAVQKSEQELAAEAAASAGTREMIINVVPRDECRIGILYNGKLEEIYMERASAENYVGNIYRGVVTNVEPSIQAAFIDFGQGKNGFLHISDLHPMFFPEGGNQTENVGRKLPRRNRPPIQRCLRRGQELNVQVTKEGIGTKGPTLTTYLSIPGRFLVMMPGMGKVGVSRRIEDDVARRELRDLMAKLELPGTMGFIARTAALGRPLKEIESDLEYLTRLWRTVESRMKSDRAPCELYRESDLVTRTIRDIFTADIGRIVVDDPEIAARAREFLSIFNPRFEDLIVEYDGPEPVFHKYGIEAELERLHSRHVPLRSGGSLVIDQTEALVAIDVNSGRFRAMDDAEETAYRINQEAADEIARQLRLRDLGGVIICDFIDMRMESHRRDIERRLVKNLKAHKERAKVLRMSAFGIIELTRQRQRASLQRSVYQDCTHCRGTGLVKTSESVALDVMRLLQLAATREQVASIEVLVSTEVAFLLQNRRRRPIYELETQHRRTVSIRPEPAWGMDQYELRCTDSRGRLVPYS